MNVFLTCELGQKHRKIINNTYGNQLCDNNQFKWSEKPHSVT